MRERVAVIGLGYVGLPVALAFGRRFPETVGYDIASERIEELMRGHDRTGEVDRKSLDESSVIFTTDPERMRGASFFIVTVPTPITADKKPNLRALELASRMVASVMQPGAVVVYESTVYPGLTEEVCGAILEEHSGLRLGVDFSLGYSPERINPGDREHTFERITKVVSGSDAKTLERVAKAYESVVPAGVHRATSIKVAEAAKVIENTQRDLNIALMNELAMIFERVGIRTKDVLDAAGTKWNFLPFTPGLVGGHCIGVDPYYLTAKAEALGLQPNVILAGRRVNDGMGHYVAQHIIKVLARTGKPLTEARVGVLGLTFKENVPDLRNSRVPDIIGELRDHGIEVIVHDPLVDSKDALRHCSQRLLSLDEFRNLDALVVAVPHQDYLALTPGMLAGMLKPGSLLVDVKSCIDPATVPELQYWSL